MTGAPWEARTDQPASAEIAKAATPWFEVLLQTFGPERCMFASNFPIEKVAAPYRTLWNAFKTLAGSLSESERDALCRGVATRVYRLGETHSWTEKDQ
jgi:predicted TIM-barrel fold metal-dependent hydrolase